MIKKYTFALLCALHLSSAHAISELNSKATFNQAIHDNNLVVVDFYMAHCGPCKIMAPLLDQVAPQLPTVNFFKINVAAADGLMSQYNIRGVPCLIFFKNGVEVGRHVGCSSNTTVASLNQEIRSAFGL